MIWQCKVKPEFYQATTTKKGLFLSHSTLKEGRTVNIGSTDLKSLQFMMNSF